MDTSVWGVVGWKFLFYVAAGYDLNETPKGTKDPQYKQFFKSAGHVLPCKYCRDSYEKFFASLDIANYMKLPSCGLIRFVYDLKNLVSDKLRAQERAALQKEFTELRQSKHEDDPEFWEIMRQKGHKICYTKPAPPFDTVVTEILAAKAGCSAHLKSCRKPLLDENYPTPPPLPMEMRNANDRAMYSSHYLNPTQSKQPMMRARIGGSRRRKPSRRSPSRSRSRSRSSKLR